MAAPRWLHCSSTRRRSVKSPIPQLRSGAQRVELRGGTEDASRHPAPRPAGSTPVGATANSVCPSVALAAAEREPVVPRRGMEVEDQPARHVHTAVELRALDLLQRARLAHALVARAVLLVQAPAQRLRIQRRGQAQREPQRQLRGAHHQHGRHALGPDPRAVGGQRAAHLLVGRCGHVHGAEQRAQRLVRDLVPPAPDVVPDRLDAVQLREMAERFYISHAVPRDRGRPASTPRPRPAAHCR